MGALLRERDARAMRAFPALDAAMAAGDVSYAKARVGGAYCAAIDAQATATNAPAEASLARQRADATAAVVTAGGGGNVQAEVIVHVRDHGNTLTDGTPISDNAVTKLLPDAFISLLMHDAQRQPIDASPRRRFPTRRQARVIDERHPECAQPGCTARHLLQHDHTQPYHQDGPTIIDNLQWLCGPHNRAKNPRTGGGRRGARRAADLPAPENVPLH